jgi:hypothetical protein
MMEKAFEVKDGAAQNHQRQPKEKPGEEHDQQKLQGKAFQVNENSVEEGEPIRPASSEPMSGDERSPQKLRGKAFQVNENSVEEGGLIRPPDSDLERR